MEQLPSQAMDDVRLGPAMRPGVAKTGGGLSIGYLALLLTYAVIQRDPFLAMKPNEFADFLAGAFAPLAFLWLVLGFIQQGQELRISSEALRIQADELRNSVEQQRQLVEVSRQQLESELEDRRRADEDAERTAAPRLYFRHGGSYAGKKRKVNFTLHNGGPSCSDVEVDFPGHPGCKCAVLSTDNVLKWSLDYESPEEMQPFEAEVYYIDIRGKRRFQRFRFPLDRTGGPYGDGEFEAPIRIA